jgi:hypothetical protein
MWDSNPEISLTPTDRWGGQIRTDDPLLPERKTLFLGKLDVGSLAENIERKGFILFSKTALNEKISICAAAALNCACDSFFLISLSLMDDLRRPQWKASRELAFGSTRGAASSI